MAKAPRATAVAAPVLAACVAGYNSVPGSATEEALVVMSKGWGIPFVQQAYKISPSFPYDWVRKKWEQAFHITAVATAGDMWALVMSVASGFTHQVVELDLQYPSEAIHYHWKSGLRITSCAGTSKQAAFVLSRCGSPPAPPKAGPSSADAATDSTVGGECGCGCGSVSAASSGPQADGASAAALVPALSCVQETLRTNDFPSDRIKDKWGTGVYITSLCYGPSLT